MSDFDLATVDRLLGTTRAVRRRLDLERPVEREVILECIRLSQQAPTGTNSQRWRWLILEDPERRRALGALYARGMPLLEASAKTAGDPQTERVYRDAGWFAARLGEAPVLAIPRPSGRSG